MIRMLITLFVLAGAAVCTSDVKAQGYTHPQTHYNQPHYHHQPHANHPPHHSHQRQYSHPSRYSPNWQPPTSGPRFSFGGSQFRSYGNGGIGYWDRQSGYGFGYVYDPWATGSFKAPDLMDDPYFRSQQKVGGFPFSRRSGR